MAGARARALALRAAEWGGLSFESKQGQGWKGLETPSEGRDNGSNELTRTPEPRLSLSSPVPCSRSIIVFLLSPSLSRLPFPLSFPRRSYSTAKLPVLFLLYFHYHRRVESNPPSLLSAFRTFLSLSLFFSSLPFPLSLAFLSFVPSRSLSLSCFRAGLGAANYPGHRYFLSENKDGQSDYYENKST